MTLSPIKEWLYGHTENISVTGTRLYATFGNVLRVYDISTPSNPSLLKEIPYAGIVKAGGLTTGHLLVSNNSAVVVAQSGEGIVIVNTSNYTTKRLTYDTYITSVFIYGNTLYVGNDNKYIVLDITNPSNPVELSRVTAATDGIFTDGTIICCTYGSALDIRNMSGTLTASINITDSIGITGLDFYGNSIVVGTRSGQVHKISNTGTITGTYNSGAYTGSKIAVYNNYAIAAFHDYRVEILNLTTTNPTLVSTYDYLSTIAGYPRDIRTVPNSQYFYIAAHMKGVDLVNISSISSPVEESKISGYGRTYSCVISNDLNYVFLADDFGLRTVDIRSTPVQVSYIDNIGRSDTSIYLDRTNNHLYVPFSWGGMRIFDVSNPSNPTTLLNFNPPEYINSLVIYQNKLYATLDTNLKVYNVNTNMTLTEIGSFPLGGRVQYIHEVIGNTAYASSDSTIIILDISNPSSIRQLSTILASSWISKVKVFNNTLYAAIRTDGLLIADVSNPSSPSIKSTTKLVYGIEFAVNTVDGKTIYMGTGTTLAKIDVSNPSNPLLVDQNTLNNEREVLYIDMYNGLLTGAFEGEGVKVFSYSTPILGCQIPLLQFQLS